MKDYESIFLGLILAGVLLMVIGFGLIMAPARSGDGEFLAAKRMLEKAPAYATRGGVAPIYR